MSDFYKNDNSFYEVYNPDYIFDKYNPRGCDNLGTMITFNDRYCSPDENDFKSTYEVIAHLAGLDAKDFIKDAYYDSYYSYNDYDAMDLECVKDKLQQAIENNGYFVIPLANGYEGTVVYANFRDGLDDIEGFIYVSEDDVKKYFGVDEITKDIVTKVYNVLENEIKDYDNYLAEGVYLIDEYDLSGELVGCDFMGYSYRDVQDYVEKSNFEYLGEYGSIESCLDEHTTRESLEKQICNAQNELNNLKAELEIITKNNIER